MGTSCTAPVVTFIESCHRWCEALRWLGIGWSEKLCKALIGEAVATQLSIAFGEGTHPRMGCCSVVCFLGKPTKDASGIALTAHVLNDNKKSLLGPPGGMGIGHG
jgi:hypothetical protein